MKLLGAVMSAAAMVAIPAYAQGANGAGLQKRDTTVVPNSGFKAGGLQRTLMGDNWRDEWGTPITVPFLDLGTFGGGLTPTETGGGLQSVTLHFKSASGREYNFRPVNKGVPLPDLYRHTLVWKMIADMRSSLYPAAPVVGLPILEAAGILHPLPELVVMPDDPRLGKFRSHFAGLVGTIEERAETPKDGPAFAAATKILESEDLIKEINKSPEDTVDTRSYLTARLVDMFLNDNDRHPGQWDWARYGSAGSPWRPIPADRDKVIHSEEGFIPMLAGMAATKITPFESRYPPVAALITQAMEMDRRLLIGLNRQTWDSVAAALTRRISNVVIDSAVHSLPHEYAFSFADLISKLRARRDGIPGLARSFYATIAEYADIHATDVAERAIVNRIGDGLVDVTIQWGSRAPFFNRRFDARETKEIRLYLHGGDDYAVVRGDVRSSIPVRIIGGDGTNTLIDSSSVGGRRNPTALYDRGTVSGTRYDKDSLDKREFSEEITPFNRRPWSVAYGELAPAQRDRGTSTTPVASLGSGHGLGLVPRIGIARYSYGFRKVPYASMMSAKVGYSTAINGFDVDLAYDKRFESSSFHVPVTGGMSQLDVVEFRGLGNDVPELPGDFADVRQRQWTFTPAVGFSPNNKSDITLGPILRYTTTDSTPNRFISQTQPYGFDQFAEAGLQLKLHYDTRGSPELWDVSARNILVKLVEENPFPAVWGKLDFTASAYPGMLDAETPYQKLSGTAALFLTAPILTRPVLALRGGGEKLYGNFPYFDAAFIGGSKTLRTEFRQRFAGDAALYGTSELRVPIANFPFILPINLGAIGFVDVARVYVDGDSPGGWHQGAGAGLWFAFVRPDLGVSVMRTNNPDRPNLVSLGFAF
ncbi:MAG TPA: hypothetical protein VFP77_11890 [Gemmatimonadaceae bacterium]|nr:hypothetical protein [Gemmatimonadaceae bacterium]